MLDIFKHLGNIAILLYKRYGRCFVIERSGGAVGNVYGYAGNPRSHAARQK